MFDVISLFWPVGRPLVATAGFPSRLLWPGWCEYSRVGGSSKTWIPWSSDTRNIRGPNVGRGVRKLGEGSESVFLVTVMLQLSS